MTATAPATGEGAALPEPWRLPFELAWEALRAGSRPIGAVLLDQDGRIAATGRNRSQETAGPPGQLVGTAIAHAEINALARLRAGRRYTGHRLYTTLEPCLLCSSALIHAHVPLVVYAAADDLWRGVEHVPRVGGTIAARWARREGPLDGPLRPLARFSELLMAVWAVRHPAPDGVPDEPAARDARRLLDAGLLDAPNVQAAYGLVSP
ncbi:nucleoside deaminase [Streptomyces sp. NPDC101151]|uniref:nucleoside deaminase n=1 Tax=Streptomyces sp. NPDC101151 TaxID=3366115 RepID=UPI0038116470